MGRSGQYGDAALIFLIIVGTLVDVNRAQQNPVGFSCDGRPSGYYADVTTGCQFYHMCDGLGRQFSYTCPNATLFQQRMLICDHWYMVNCSKSESDFPANLLIGQRDKPFVEDDRENPYHRTPRPDLLTNPNTPEYNIIYRIQSAANNLNVVGADNGDGEDGNNDNNNNANNRGRGTDQPAYSPPSHWSTEYQGKDGHTFPTSPKTTVNQNDPNTIAIDTTSKPLIRNYKPLHQIKFDNSIVSRQTTVNSAPVAQRRNDPAPSIINFESNYKATTPVFPRDAPPTAPTLLQDVPDAATPTGGVNFRSSYKATTPVFPSEAPPSAQSDFLGRSDVDNNVTQRPIVNFESSYRATTPVYPPIAPPMSIDNLPESDVPTVNNNNNNNRPSINAQPIVVADRAQAYTTERVPVNFESNYKATTPVFPLQGPQSTEPSTIFDATLPPIGAAAQPQVNFRSSYAATTPVFPVEAPTTLPTPFASSRENQVDQQLSRDVLPPRDDSFTSNDVLNNNNNNRGVLGAFPNNPFLSGRNTGDIQKDVQFTGDANSPSSNNNPLISSRNQDLLNANVQFHFDPSSPLNPTNPFLRPGETPKIPRAPAQSIDWPQLRKQFLIPEYDFPLENIAGNTSYNGGLNSFQVNVGPRE